MSDLTFTQLREKLDISQHRLTKLIHDGLPFHGQGRKKLFDPQQVADWLLASGQAVLKQPEPPATLPMVARTKGECANHFSVSTRAVGEWLLDPSFPGRSGTRGRQDGYFPLDEIRTWLSARDAAREGGININNELTSRRRDLLDIKIERERRVNQQEAGALAPISEMVELVQRLTYAAKQILESVPDEAAKDLPSDMPEQVKAQVIARWRKRIHEIERVISEAIAGDADAESDEPQQQAKQE